MDMVNRGLGLTMLLLQLVGVGLLVIPQLSAYAFWLAVFQLAVIFFISVKMMMGQLVPIKS
jgi:hypothetical protein